MIEEERLSRIKQARKEMREILGLDTFLYESQTWKKRHFG
jgi:hypothetical protein